MMIEKFDDDNDDVDNDDVGEEKNHTTNNAK